VFLSSGQFLGDEVRAGETTTRTAVVENAADGPVSVAPVVVSERGSCRGSSPPGALPGEWVTVDAPTEIAPGEPVRIEFTVAPPEGADVGRYGAEYTLGIDDPARPDDDDYWQQADLEVGVWRVPGESITRSFEVRAEDDAETVTLSARTDGERPGFRVALVSPIGARYEREPTTVRRSGGRRLRRRRRASRRRPPV